jgi:hypothetical protein
VEKLQAKLSPYADLWQVANDWSRYYSKWMFTSVFEMDYEFIERTMPVWLSQLLVVQKAVTALLGQRAVDLYNTIHQFWSQLPVVRAAEWPLVFRTS